MRRTEWKMGECHVRKERALKKNKRPLEVTQVN